MVYSLLFILGGVILMFIAIKLKKSDENMFVYTKSLEGIFAAILIIVLGIITLFIGW